MAENTQIEIFSTELKWETDLCRISIWGYLTCEVQNDMFDKYETHCTSIGKK